MRATADHLRRVGRCADALAGEQHPDGGWGLTRGQPPSLVNTTEALMVLQVAGRPSPAIESGLGYVTRNVAEHCAPATTGGRGEKTRYVAFSLWALAECGRDHTDGLTEVLAWILDWLEDHGQEDGWGEEAGIVDCSLFETALVARGLGILLRRVDDGDLAVTHTQRPRAHELLTVAAGGLLSHRLARGWPQRAHTSRHSAAKTAWCLLGLAEAVQVPKIAAQAAIEEAIREGVEDLTHRVAVWRRSIETDPDVVAAVWSHLAYSLCLEAITKADGDAVTAALLPAWSDLDSAWSDTHGRWLELTQPAMPTVRATCYSALALEALRHQYGERGLVAIARQRQQNDVNLATLWELRADISGDYALISNGNIRPVTFSATQRRLLAALATTNETPTVILREQLAKALNVSIVSLGVAVSRVNAAVAEQIPDFDRRLVIAERGSGYKLNVTRIVRQ